MELTEITPDDLEEYLEDYIADLRDDGKSESTVTQKERVCTTSPWKSATGRSETPKRRGLV